MPLERDGDIKLKRAWYHKKVKLIVWRWEGKETLFSIAQKLSQLQTKIDLKYSKLFSIARKTITINDQVRIDLKYTKLFSIAQETITIIDLTKIPHK